MGRPIVRRASRGRPEAPDVAQQHPVATRAVEDQRAVDHDLSPLPSGEALARRVPDLRVLQRPPGRRALTLRDVTGPGSSADVRVAVDLLGGGDAAAVLEGVLSALGADPRLSVAVVGPPPLVQSLLAARVMPERLS